MRRPERSKPSPKDSASRPALTPSDSDDELAMLARALGHPARVYILRMLARKPCHFGEFVEELWLAQPTVSQHLKMLKQVRLIRSEDDGPRVRYSVEPHTFRRLKALLAHL